MTNNPPRRLLRRGITERNEKMERYEIYKSEGGYRVAANVYLNCPVVGSSPWFDDKEKAEDFRVKCIRGRIERLDDMRDDYPKSVIDAEIAELRKLLDRKCA